MVHLGSQRFPDEREYKTFLAQHGGSSNASTSMVHTRYHFKVHAEALPGALARCAREVENVHAEYSRNTNSDGRKLLQLRRSLCLPPYSNFSTGSLATLWEQPQQQGADVAGMLRELWQQCYRAGSTCVAVVGPQEPAQLLQWVAEAFADMPSSSSSSSSSSAGDDRGINGSVSNSSKDSISIQAPLTADTAEEQQQQDAAAVQPQQRYPVDVAAPGARGLLVRVLPQRELRELQLCWYIPAGAVTHSSCKPWQWASHLLGHEGPGSLAHLLKAQGLVQSLDAGMGEEVRQGRGWMFWRLTLSLTQAGEEAVDHVVATVYRAIQVLQRCSDEQLQKTWQEAATLAQLRFDWRDPVHPLAAAQSAAYSLHYYPASETLSGPALMTQHDVPLLRWFVGQLTAPNMNVYYSSRCNAGLVDGKEAWYGAEYGVHQLPQAWLDSIARYQAVDCHSAEGAAADVPQQQQRQQQQEALTPVPGQLHLPEPNWALPTDFDLRLEEGQSAAPAAAAAGAGVYDGAAPPPALLLQQPGLCAWHRRDTSFGLPKVHLRLHLVTPAVYASPAATVSTRLLLRVLEDLLLPQAYPAELAGSSYSLDSERGGLLLRLVGFPGVAAQLLRLVLQGLLGLTAQQVRERFTTMQGRLLQGLTNWANNNPAQHAEYGAHHLLQQQHHHNAALLQAAAAAAPGQLLALQQQLASGSDLHVDLLAYGNIGQKEAAELVREVQQQLQPQGLPPHCWPPASEVLCLSRVAGVQLEPSLSSPAAAAAQGVGKEGGVTAEVQQPQAAAARGQAGEQLRSQQALAPDGMAAAAAGDSAAVYITYVPVNPNPSNSNSAVYYILQLGPDSIETAVLLDLFVQMSSKACFYELRTRQRLGYSVSLSSSSLHRQLGLMVRVQSPSKRPDALAAAVRAWLAGFRVELQEMAAGVVLQNQKKALVAKYLDPPKSLQEAAKRAWRPIRERTLQWDRRRQKATAAQALTAQQLLEFFDAHLCPAAVQHKALCVQVWGGRKGMLAAAGASAGEKGTAAQAAGGAVAAENAGGGGAQQLTVLADDVEQFKQSQPLMPAPDVFMPPPAAAGWGIREAAL
ncbi:Metalloenzyme, LuxS/M16 peptidase-like protein [Scenedesmus sp. NREL 46B-D3]|nr:Metalloenzyme, LuxS/M16 peptidase-like protein [Scenedesmus sp. NREL 46B-D3]